MGTHRRYRSPKPAFTLIELLVVIAIIAILASLVLPVIRAVRRHAKTTACLNNVQQCAYALQFYLDENREMCPPWITFDGCAPPHGNWWWTSVHYLLQEYADDPRDIWRCPADDTHDCTPWDGSPHGGDDLTGCRRGCSYVYNNGGGSSAHALFEGLSISRLEGRRLEAIANPSRKIAMFCWCAHNFWPGEGRGRERLQWWHSDRPRLVAPVGFLDCSAAAVTIVPGQPETSDYRW